MCGSSGKMNSTWEYMVRKFIAHAWDEPSGARVEVEVEGRAPHSPGLVSIRLGRAISQTIQGGLVEDLLANSMTQSHRRNQFSHIWDFPTVAMGQAFQISHQTWTQLTHTSSGIWITCVRCNMWVFICMCLSQRACREVVRKSGQKLA